MKPNSNILFIIPARGGSKGILKKNIKPLDGKPLIYYSIDIARAFTTDNNICISTDDKEIVQTVEQYGIKVPFIRPLELASDYAGTDVVLRHALQHYQKKGIYYKIIILLQPTSPFRKIADVSKCIDLFYENIDMVVSVKESAANPYFNLFEENKDGFLEKSKSSNFKRRQDCPKVFEYNGAVYVINVESILNHDINSFKNIKKIEMDAFSSLDLDTPLDWKIAETYLTTNDAKKNEKK